MLPVVSECMFVYVTFHLSHIGTGLCPLNRSLSGREVSETRTRILSLVRKFPFQHEPYERVHEHEHFKLVLRLSIIEDDLSNKSSAHTRQKPRIEETKIHF